MEMLRGATHTLAALEPGVPCPERCACALTVRDAAQQLARVGASHGLRHLLDSLKQLQRALEQLALLGARLHVPDVCASLRACAASAPHSALPSICSCLASIHCDPALPHILRSASSLAPLLPRSPESAPSLAPCIPNRELPPSCRHHVPSLLSNQTLLSCLSTPQLCRLAACAPDSALSVLSAFIRSEAQPEHQEADPIGSDLLCKLCAACATSCRSLIEAQHIVHLSLAECPGRPNGTVRVELKPLEYPESKLANELAEALIAPSLISNRAQVEPTALAVSLGGIRCLYALISSPAISSSAKACALKTAASDISVLSTRSRSELQTIVDLCEHSAKYGCISERIASANLLSAYGKTLCYAETLDTQQKLRHAVRLAADMLWSTHEDERSAWIRALARLPGGAALSTTRDTVAHGRALVRKDTMESDIKAQSAQSFETLCNIVLSCGQQELERSPELTIVQARCALAGKKGFNSPGTFVRDAAELCASQALNCRLRTRLGGPKSTLEGFLNAVRSLPGDDCAHCCPPFRDSAAAACALQLPFALEKASGDLVGGTSSAIRTFMASSSVLWYAWLGRIREPLAFAHLAAGLPAAALHHAERGLEADYRCSSGLARVYAHAAAQLREPHLVSGVHSILQANGGIDESELKALEFEAAGCYEKAIKQLCNTSSIDEFWAQSLRTRCLTAVGKLGELRAGSSSLELALGCKRLDALAHFDPCHTQSSDNKLCNSRSQGELHPVGLAASLFQESTRLAEDLKSPSRLHLQNALCFRALFHEGWNRDETDLHLSNLLSELQVSKSDYVDLLTNVPLPEDATYHQLPDLMRRLRTLNANNAHVEECTATAASAALDGENTDLARVLLRGVSAEMPLPACLLIQQDEGFEEGYKALARIAGEHPPAACKLASLLSEHQGVITPEDLEVELHLPQRSTCYGTSDLSKTEQLRGQLIRSALAQLGTETSRGRRACWQYAEWLWTVSGLNATMTSPEVKVWSADLVSAAAESFSRNVAIGVKPQTSLLHLLGIADMTDDNVEPHNSTTSLPRKVMSLCQCHRGSIDLWEGLEPQLFGLASHRNESVRRGANDVITHLITNFCIGPSITIVASDCEMSLAAHCREQMRREQGSTLSQIDALYNGLSSMAVLPEERISAAASSIKRALDRGESHDMLMRALTRLRRDEFEAENLSSRMRTVRRRLGRKIDTAEASLDGRGGDPASAIESLCSSANTLLEDKELQLHDLQPYLSALRMNEIPLPGKTRKEERLHSVRSYVEVLNSKTRPKRIGFCCTDGTVRTYLLKGRESLALDEIMAQLTYVARQKLLQNSLVKDREHLITEPYGVQTLGPHAGLVEWVDDAMTLDSIFKRWQRSRLDAAAGIASLPEDDEASSGDGELHSKEYEAAQDRPAELFQRKIAVELKKYNIQSSKTSRKEWPEEALRAVFDQLSNGIPKNMIRNEIEQAARCAGEAHEAGMRLTSKLAATSSFCHAFGLGDRHLGNVLLDVNSSSIVHVDMGVTFGAGERLRVPEVVPFRLTKTLVGALGLSGVNGPFASKLEQSLSALRGGSSHLLLLIRCGLFWRPPPDWVMKDDSLDQNDFQRAIECIVHSSQNTANLSDYIYGEDKDFLQALAAEDLSQSGLEDAKEMQRVAYHHLENAWASWRRCKAEANSVVSAANEAQEHLLISTSSAIPLQRWLECCGANAASAAIAENQAGLNMYAADEARQTVARWDALQLGLQDSEAELSNLSTQLPQLRADAEQAVQEATDILESMDTQHARIASSRACDDVLYTQRCEQLADSVSCLESTVAQCHQCGAVLGLLLASHSNCMAAQSAAELANAASMFCSCLYTCAAAVAADEKSAGVSELSLDTQRLSALQEELEEVERRTKEASDKDLAVCWDDASKVADEQRRAGSTRVATLDKSLEGAVKASSRLESAGVDSVTRALLRAYTACLRDVASAPIYLYQIAADRAINGALHQAGRVVLEGVSTHSLEEHHKSLSFHVSKVEYAASRIKAPQVLDVRRQATRKRLSLLREREAFEGPRAWRAAMMSGEDRELFERESWKELLRDINMRSGSSNACNTVAQTEHECTSGAPAIREATWALALRSVNDARAAYEKACNERAEAERKRDIACQKANHTRATLRELLGEAHSLAQLLRRGSHEQAMLRKLLLHLRGQGAWSHANTVGKCIDACRAAAEDATERCKQTLSSEGKGSNGSWLTVLAKAARNLCEKVDQLSCSLQSITSRNNRAQSTTIVGQNPANLPNSNPMSEGMSSEYNMQDGERIGHRVHSGISSDDAVQARALVAQSPSTRAVEACNEIEERLSGTECSRSESCAQQAQRLIEAAVSTTNLSRMYEGWVAWV